MYSWLKINIHFQFLDLTNYKMTTRILSILNLKDKNINFTDSQNLKDNNINCTERYVFIWLPRLKTNNRKQYQLYT